MRVKLPNEQILIDALEVVRMVPPKAKKIPSWIKVVDYILTFLYLVVYGLSIVMIVRGLIALFIWIF